MPTSPAVTPSWACTTQTLCPSARASRAAASVTSPATGDWSTAARITPWPGRCPDCGAVPSTAIIAVAGPEAAAAAPRLTVPVLTVPVLTAPDLTAPDLTAPALAVPVLTAVAPA